MNLRFPSSATLRHHVRALGCRISPFVVSLPHQLTNILLLLPVLVFLTLYLYNERQSARIKTQLEYERVVWPQHFGFPEWYGKPRVLDYAESDEAIGGKEERTEDVLPWNSEIEREARTDGQPTRILGLIRE